MRSGKFDGVLICSDFDNTYCPANDVIPPANLEAIRYFQSQGGRFTIATGRARSTFLPKLPLAPVNAPVILSNGGQLYDVSEGRMLAEHLLSPQAAKDMEEVSSQFPQVALEVYYEDLVYVWNPNDWSRRHLVKVGTPATECPIGEMPIPWAKALFHQEHDQLLPVQQYIEAHWPGRYEVIFSAGHLLELAEKGVNKGAMVLELAKRLNIRREDLYCVGDNQNDLSMLAVSAAPYAPSNCTPEVREAGAVILPSCEEGAIAGLIRLLDERY